MIEYYKSLPDYMSVDELKNLFNSFLSNVRDSKYDLGDALESLLELADRQWHTYELLNEDIKCEIEDWLISIVNSDSKEITEYTTLIIARLGLSRLYGTIKASLAGNLREEVRQIITEIINEVDGHVEDPYYGMR